jgi:phospholipase A2
MISTRCILVLLCHHAYVIADTITLRNFTAIPVYGALYYVQGKSNDGQTGNAQQITNPVLIPARGNATIERPPRKTYGSLLNTRWYDRDLYIAQDQDTLLSEVPKGSLPFVNVGDMQGREFFITSLGDQLAGFPLNTAQNITLKNETNTDIYTAIYYLEGTSSDQRIGRAFRFNEAVKIAPHASQTIMRPPRRCKFYIQDVCSNFEDRDLYISLQQDDLKSIVPKGSLASINIGATQGNYFYLSQDDAQLIGHTLASRTLLPLTKTVAMMYDKILARLHVQFEQHEHQHVPASIRTADSVAPQEQTYIAQRTMHVKNMLQNLLHLELPESEVPIIALCGSGGGCRAMLSTLGSLAGLEHLGLLDACAYSAGLSGSTWAISTWLQSQMRVQDYINSLAPRFRTDIKAPVSMEASKQITQSLLARLAFHQRISIIDIYGGLLAEKFLKRDDVSNPQQITLAQQVNFIKPSEKPFPVYTALIAQKPYEWVEYTPYEIGAPLLASFVPTWAYGRTFNQGISDNFAPALSLGLCMGTWGSAIAVSMQEALEVFAESMPATVELFGIKIPTAIIMQELTQSFKKIPQMSNQRVYPANVPNWMMGLPGPYQHINHLTLVDAGLDINLPVPPLLRAARNVSIIIMLDASATVHGAPELRKAEAYARRHNLKFPHIDYTKINELCSVHQDEDPTIPTVIYMPLVANENYQNGWEPLRQKFTSTFNFVYTPQEIELLTGLTKTNMLASKDMIIDAIKSSIEKKRAAKSAVSSS